MMSSMFSMPIDRRIMSALYTGCNQFLVELRVCGGSRMDNQRFCIGYAGRAGRTVPDYRWIFLRQSCPFTPPVKMEPAPLGKYLSAKALYLLPFEVRIIHPCNFGMSDQKIDHFAGIFHMPFHREARAFQFPAKGGMNWWADARAGIAQDLSPDFGGEGNAAQIAETSPL